MDFVRRDPCVPLALQHLHHHRIGRYGAAGDHGEDPGRAAGHQRYTLLIHGRGLLTVTAGHIPEHYLGQLVAVYSKQPLCVGKQTHER